MAEYSFITKIDAKNRDNAEDARSEAVGGIEDARESGLFPDSVNVSAGDLVEKDLDEVLSLYRKFHDRMSDLVEDGKLHSFRDTQPAEYTWMVEAMAEIAGADAKDATERFVDGDDE